MKLHQMVRSKGLTDKSNRKGRGNGSKGNTSGKGHKGQGARSGYGLSRGFEGGQTPLIQRVPKLKGFKRYYKLIEDFSVINLGDIQKDDRFVQEVSRENLITFGYSKKNQKIKVLGNGELLKGLSFVGIDKFSKSAIVKINSVGGKIVE